MGYNASIQRKGADALFDLKGLKPTVQKYAGASLPNFPDSVNTATVKNDISLMHIGCNHWLVRASLDQEAAVEEALKPSEAPFDVSIVCISDTLTIFSVTGPDADQIMSIATSLDIHPTVFPATGATFSEIFGLKALIIRQPGGFLFAVEQSFGDMIEDYLTRALA